MHQEIIVLDRKLISTTRFPSPTRHGMRSTALHPKAAAADDGEGPAEYVLAHGNVGKCG